VGKGPSFQPTDFCDEYQVVALNQAIAAMDGCCRAIEHAIDYEAWVGLWGMDMPRIRDVWMPFEPQWRERSGSGNLRAFRSHDRWLEWFDRGGRLYTYDLFGSTDKLPDAPDGGNKPEIYSYSSTFEATLHILNLLGVKKVFTLGIDGGTERHPLFQNDYRREHVSYDKHKDQTDTLIKRLGMEVVKL